MYCVDCGEEILKDATYCVGCGKVLKVGGETSQRKKIRPGRIISGLIILASLFMLIGYFTSADNERSGTGYMILGYGTVILGVYLVLQLVRWLAGKAKGNKPEH